MATGSSNAQEAEYSVIFVNNSTQTGSACMFQQDPDIGVPNALSLAWFAQIAAPTTTLTFTWTAKYSFVWSQTGTLRPGIRFTPAQTWPADLDNANQVTFDNVGGAYTFKDQEQGPNAGLLYIRESGEIAPLDASVGIGMSGVGTFVAQAQPNTTVEFTLHPQYWIVFGTFVQGEVVDIQTMNNPAQIVFPPNVFSMTAILKPDNSWDIKPTSEVNAEFLEARKTYPELTWGQDPNTVSPTPRG